MVTHESFPLHSSLLHNPPGSDIAHVGCRPNSLKREILEPELKNAPQSPDAYGADEPWLFADLDGKEPISVGIWLTVGNGLFNER